MNDAEIPLGNDVLKSKTTAVIVNGKYCKHCT